MHSWGILFTVKYKLKLALSIKCCVSGDVSSHKSGAAEGGEVARNQAPQHRLDWPIVAMFILGIRKSKIKQNGYYLFFHFLLLNISHNAGKTLLLTHF